MQTRREVIVAAVKIMVEATGYINVTSTCDCTFRPVFAGQFTRILMNIRAKNTLIQTLAA